MRLVLTPGPPAGLYNYTRTSQTVQWVPGRPEPRLRQGHGLLQGGAEA